MTSSPGNEPQLGSEHRTPEMVVWHQAEALYQQAQVALVRGALGEASDLLREALDHAPHHAGARRLLTAVEEANTPEDGPFIHHEASVGGEDENALGILALILLTGALGACAGAWLGSLIVELLPPFGLSILLIGVMFSAGGFTGLAGGMLAYGIQSPGRGNKLVPIAASLLTSVIAGGIGAVLLPIIVVIGLVFLVLERSLRHRSR